ncbi:MAG: transglycosylase domain-containing protein [Clostridia bacterium]|nr:transglycosylase domain-containing protein [Clostridia bacterium]
MDQKNINHEDDVMTAFENLKKSIDSLDGTNGAADMKASAHTQVITPTKKDGVIDRAEWDRMLAEIDAKNAKEKEMAAAAEEESKAEEGGVGVVGTRAARHASKKSALGGIAAAKTAKEVKEKKPKAPKEKAPKEPKEPKEKKKKSKAAKIILRLFIAFVILGLIGCIAVGVIVGKIIKESPEINPNNIYDLLSQSSVIYDINGSVVDNIYTGDALRTNVDYDEIPQDLVNAFVSIEDKTFWEHNGFNFRRIVGAVWEKVSGKKARIGGTSTITQQLARNIFLTDTRLDRDMVRKIREAYYTVIIEKTLSKEQIIEAYLNTVYLGFNSNGVSAAARAYFNKDLSELKLLECAQLAALPQSPNSYAPLKRIATENVTDIEKYDVVVANDSWVTYYNDTASGRVKTVLNFMHEQGKIDDETYELAMQDSIRNYLNPGVNIGSSANDSSYFTDYITSQVMKDLQNKLGYTYQEAHDLLYKGGLVVNSTLDMEVQTILEDVYADPNNFPKISLNSVALDKQKNIMNADKDRVILYAIKNMLDDNGNFVLKKGEFKWNDNGSLTIYKGNRLNFFNTKANGETDVRVDLKDMYEQIDGQLYSRSGSYLLLDAKYKTRDDAGNLIISKDCFDETKVFTKNDDGTVTVSADSIVVGSPIIQPQSAMTIIDNATGQIRAMIGGRGISGKLLFNRATSTRQPGSSMKPLSVYSTALQLGYDATKKNAQTSNGANENGEALEAKIFTAATILDNIPLNLKNDFWPSNFDGTYGGRTTLRKAVEKSLNGCAVNLYMQLDPHNCIENIQNLGITSLVTTGDATDENASSLALGGMIKGVSPLEMASAYSTFGNYGVHNETSCYTTVTNRKGDIILKAESHSVQVLDEEVASLMLDILQSTVNVGIANGAKLTSQPSAGKTGTTSEMYDIWFCGLTPKYSASTWVGCDSNVNLGSDSSKATKVWKAVMERVGKLDERGEFELRGNFVEVSIDNKTGQLPLMSEYAETPETDIIVEKFIKGTQPTDATTDLEARGYVKVCAETGYLATDYCPHVAYKEYIARPSGMSWEKILAGYTLIDEKTDVEKDKALFLNLILDAGFDKPDYYCPLPGHNPVVDVNAETGEFIYANPVSPIVRQEYDVEGLEPVETEQPEEGEEIIPPSSGDVEENPQKEPGTIMVKPTDDPPAYPGGPMPGHWEYNIYVNDFVWIKDKVDDKAA